MPHDLRTLQPTDALSEKTCGGYLSLAEFIYTNILFFLNIFVNKIDRSFY